jgi:hypothetical protein
MKKKFLDFFLVIASIYVIADVFQLSLPSPSKGWEMAFCGEEKKQKPMMNFAHIKCRLWFGPCASFGV